MTDLSSHEIRLKSRPVGVPDRTAFELAETVIGAPAAGEVRVRNIWMSVDPYMRFQMMEQKHYPGWEIGKPLTGAAIGRVVDSGTPGFAAGDLVESQFGWREYFVATPDKLNKIKTGSAPLRAYLGAAGIPGFSAYIGLMHIARLKDGETVFVSGAAGAVGIIACQLARLKGCVVIGTTGSDEKCDWLRAFGGVQHAINYRTCGRLKTALASAAPGGIHVFFDNVGGEHLVAGIANMADFGRIAICGTISQYNSTSKAEGPHNLNLIVPKRLRLEGFEIADHFDIYADFRANMDRMIEQGQIRSEETVFDGIENAPEAFIRLFSGGNLGKMLVRVGPE